MTAYATRLWLAIVSDGEQPDNLLSLPEYIYN